MKKIILTIVALCAVFSAFAQEKGQMYLMPTLEFDFGKSTKYVLGDTEPSFYDPSFYIGAEYGYFLSDAIRVGMFVGFDISSSKSSELLKNTTYLVSFNPNISYFLKLADKFYYAPELGVSYSIGKSKAVLDNTISATKNINEYMAYFQPLSFELKFNKTLSILLNPVYLVCQRTDYLEPNDRTVVNRYDKLMFDVASTCCLKLYF